MIVPPGGTIGILGGGQLGRMLTQAAHELGFKVCILCPEDNSPAAQIADQCIVAAYKREDALDELANRCDVITYEFENIPVHAARYLERDHLVRPGSKPLQAIQNRLDEKTFLNSIGVPTTAFAAITQMDDLIGQGPLMGMPCVLKTQRGGYDGKGQVIAYSKDELAPAWQQLMLQPVIIEAFVPFTRELSIICTRGINGAVAFYPMSENDHRNHILHQSTAPADTSDMMVMRAQDMARHIVEGLDYVGTLAVELFETEDGSLLVNEIAPRVHNSGHWTIEACATSQFANHIRAITGMPLGATTLKHRAVMTNLIGDEIEQAAELDKDPNIHVHDYGKAEARPGRKMGHYTKLSAI
jgi:5-(carboxyamino)imidazole ribonucleotide synthase